MDALLHNVGITARVALFTYAAYLAGALILRRLRIVGDDRFFFRTYACLAGFAAFGWAGMVLAALGIFTASALWLVLASVALIGRRDIARHLEVAAAWVKSRERKGRVRRFFAEHGFLKGVILAWLLLNLLIVFVPITGHDTLDYHLPIIQSIVAEGRLTFDPSIPSYPHLPVMGEILYAIPMALFGNNTEPFTFQLFQYLALPFMLLIVYDLLRGALRERFLGFASLLGILAIMDFEREVLHGGYVDVYAFLFGMGSFFLILKRGSQGELRKPELYLSALLLGASIGVKYTGFFFGAANALFFCIYFMRRKEFVDFFRNALWYGGIAAIVGGYWYLKNAIIFGNPVYPMFSDAQATANVGFFLFDRTFLNFLMFPFVRYGQWFVQEVETSSRLVVLGYFILAYLLIAFFLVRREKIGTLAISLFVFIELYLVFLFFSSHQYRFLIPGTIALPPLLALLADRFYERARRLWSERVFQRLMRFSLVLVHIATLFLLIANIHYFEVKFRYLTGYYDQEEYILEIGGQ